MIQRAEAVERRQFFPKSMPWRGQMPTYTCKCDSHIPAAFLPSQWRHILKPCSVVMHSKEKGKRPAKQDRQQQWLPCFLFPDWKRQILQVLTCYCSFNNGKISAAICVTYYCIFFEWIKIQNWFYFCWGFFFFIFKFCLSLMHVTELNAHTIIKLRHFSITLKIYIHSQTKGGQKPPKA